MSFADSVGLELASIRYMTEGRDTPPNLERFHQNHQLKEKQPRPNPLKPQFLQPIHDFGEFYSKLHSNCVALESVAVVNNVINGIIKVRNIAYEKYVKILYTTDGWKTKATLPCYYVNSLNSMTVSNHFDAFSFQLETKPDCDRLDFCIEYSCAGQTYWDSNSSKNYTLVRNKQTDS